MGWDKLVPSSSPLPISQKLLYAFCGYLFSVGRQHSAIALNLGFNGYLRAMELLCLRSTYLLLPGDTQLPSEAHGVQQAGCLLPFTKTGPNQFIPFSDLTTLAGVCHNLLQGRTKRISLLFSISYVALSEDLKRCVAYFGL